MKEPVDLRERFIQRELDNLERVGSDEALLAAIQWCAEYQRPLPTWAVKGVQRALTDLGIKAVARKGRHARRETAARESRIHYTRWDAVHELRDRRHELQTLGYKPTWEEAYFNASETLQGTEAAGSPEAIKKSYQLVNRLFKSAKGARFYVIK